MKLLALIILLSLLPEAHAGSDVIYGKDNRKDLFEETNPLFKALATGTAAMISMEKLKRTQGKDFYHLSGVPTLEEKIGLCSTEAFAQQPAAASCSGFLVSKDTLVTAGHCFALTAGTPVQTCEDFAWVFDFNLKTEKANPKRNIFAQNVYRCKEVVTVQFNKQLDFSIIKLDRPVEGRAPLAFKNRGTITPSTPLVVMGHPSGLPLKITDGGRVTKNQDKNKFSTSLDTFHGNSGSAVFNADNGEIVGILIEGKTDYIKSEGSGSNSCLVLNACAPNAKECQVRESKGPQRWGEVVLRIEIIAQAINKAISQRD
jgi:V8-like Glu-specific endopeptidase